MAYHEALAERVNQELTRRGIPFYEKKMFGGVAFMVDEKMTLGVNKNYLMARTDPAEYDELIERHGAQPMDFTGRPMKGFIFITDDGWDSDDDLTFWVDKCMAYNPKAKASKKKTRK